MCRTIRFIVLLLTAFAHFLLALAAPSAAAGPSHAEQIFARFKALDGTWRGENAAGDPVHASYRVVANGTAVVEHFVHESHGDEAMVTVYHLDGDAVRLTHYCMAGNQPRMRSTVLREQDVSFELVDVTGLTAPEAGHMRAATYHFTGPDRFRTAWTWHESGTDQFTEDIEMRRVEASAAEAP